MGSGNQSPEPGAHVKMLTSKCKLNQQIIDKTTVKCFSNPNWQKAEHLAGVELGGTEKNLTSGKQYANLAS